MNNDEVLTAAIKKAIAGGWLPYFALFDNHMTKETILIRYPEGSSAVNFDYQVPGHIVGVGGYSLEPASIIFDHGFAKAIAGDQMLKYLCDTVCAKDPLQELAKWL